MTIAPAPDCKDATGHDWRMVAVEPGGRTLQAYICHRCAARYWVFRKPGGTMKRYARTPLWGTPDDLHAGGGDLMHMVTPAPVPETTEEAIQRERREWRQKMEARVRRR